MQPTQSRIIITIIWMTVYMLVAKMILLDCVEYGKDIGFMCRRLLRDYALVPSLLGDNGHYLFMTMAAEEGLMGDGLEVRRERMDGMELVDTRLGVVSRVDRLDWEENVGRYRIHISPHCSSRYCPRGLEEEYEQMRGRLVLAMVTRNRLAGRIASDYAVVGTRRVERATRRQRREDVRRIHRVRAILEGRSHLLPIAEAHGRLFPNGKIDYGETIFRLSEEGDRAKRRAIEQTKDLSMIWQCGQKRRERLREQRIFSWDDPRFLGAFQKMIPGSRLRVIERMIRLHANPDPSVVLDVPASGANWLRQRVPGLRERELRLEDWIFVDFETDFQKQIYLVGFSNSVLGYQSMWASGMSDASERHLMDRVHTPYIIFYTKARPPAQFVFLQYIF